MVTDEELMSKLWPQNCGDSLKVIEKTSLQKRKGSNYLYRCLFQKYPYEILALKDDIIRNKIVNPQIEQVEFIDKLWPQNCGDILKIVEKTSIKSSNKKDYLWKCQFKKYPCEILATKTHIKNGVVNNPEIENQNFIGKEFLQNCGDILIVTSKTNVKKEGHFLYSYKFVKYPFEGMALKGNILKGSVSNPELPWKNKENLEKFLKQNYLNKGTLINISESLSIAPSTLGQAINKFGLNNYIQYSYANGEGEIKKFLEEIDCISCTKWFDKNINYKEIDIFIKEKNIGFEYNGNYWHSELFKKRNYHQEKTLIFNKIGIKIFHIFEYEWEEKQNILKFYIKSKLGLFNKVIGARQCSIKELQSKEYQNFCNQNHLQGQAGAKIKLGLFYKDELVQIMSFGSPRFTDKFNWEVIRECSKLGYKIIGGKEKLWKYFVKKHNPQDCISYCDFSKFTGESYLKLGFEQERLNEPGFVWWDEKKHQVFWRSPEKHQEMKKKYFRIYDCGQLVFTWYKNK